MLKKLILKANNQFKSAVWKKLTRGKILEINLGISIILDLEKNKLDLCPLKKAQKIIKILFKNQIQPKLIPKSKLKIMCQLKNKKK